MKREKGLLRSFALLLALCMLLSVGAGAKVSQKEIDSLKGSAGDLATKRKNVKKQLAALSADKSQMQNRKKLIDDQIDLLSAEIANEEAQIAGYESLIVSTQEDLTAAEEKEKAQYALFCERVRAMEERGTVSYWSVLFKAADFTDLLGRLDFVKEVMESDQRVIQTLQDLQTEIAEKKSSLEGQLADSVAVKADLQEKKNEQAQNRKEANSMIAQIDENTQEYKEILAKIAAEEEAIQARIVKLSKELAAQSGGAPATLGGYQWPVSSKKISSPFGKRRSPGGVGSTNHKGVDIAGVGYQSEVHAAKGGTVIVSQYSSSYGNYVVISHGSGNTTLYAHMSKLKVSEGAKVTQGQTVGITGSTGHSTGPHLHFEITEGGNRVNPLNYLTNYIKAW